MITSGLHPYSAGSKSGQRRGAMLGLAERTAHEPCGHDDPREAFVEAMALQDDERARRLAGQLRECADVVPVSCCIWLGFPVGTSYAEAAERTLRRKAWMRS
jgi:hypothetical protein